MNMPGPRRRPWTAPPRHSPSSLPSSRLVPALFAAVALASRCADAAAVKGVISHEKRGTAAGPDGGDDSSPLGSTPTTSVALIILYSITGIITALFLLIIVTGAVRAHRHPERYGPRATARHGQPRQSRAKGIARAVLDGIPIVRFGPGGSTAPDTDPTPKPADVEMQTRDSTLMSDGRSEIDATGSRSAETEQVAGGPTTAAATEEEHAEKSRGGGETKHSELATEPVNQEQLTCPVCMDEFEEGQEMRVLPCHHNFHPVCIDPWLLNVSGSCPLCRTDLHPHSEEAAPAEEPIAPEEAHLPPPYNGRTEHSPERHHHHLGLSRYLNLARNSSGDERMAALRQLRQENRSNRSPEDGENAGARRNSVLGLGKLKSALRSNRHTRTDIAGGAATPDSTATPSNSG